MTWDHHGEQKPLPHPWVRNVDAFIQANWRLILFAALMAYFLIAPFFSPIDMPDWMIRD
jgi:hypothetical protein